MAKKHKSTIYITNLRIHPISEKSDLKMDYPGFKRFTNRSHFLLFTSQEAVATTFEVYRNENPETDRKPVKETVLASLVDLNTGATVASVRHRYVMDAWRDYDHVRIDIPVDYESLSVESEYEVSVETLNTDEMPLWHPLRFRLPKPYPTSYYIPTAGGVKKADSDTLFGAIGYLSSVEDGIDPTVVLDFDSGLSDWDYLPEVYVRFHTGLNDDSALYDLPADIQLDPATGKGRIAVAFPVGAYAKGPIYAEFRTMGFAFAGFVFNTGEIEIEATFTGDELRKRLDYYRQEGERFLNARFPELAKTVGNPEDDAAALELDGLVGLEGVKEQIENLGHLMAFNSLRSKAGLAVVQPPLHCLFLGAPGTGKTTVAKIMGRLMHKCGVLSKGHVVVRERATLLGQFYSSEAEKTLEALDEAQGGILFIDEAYQLFQPEDPKDPGRFVLETLMTALADENKRDWMLILAGYTEPTKRLLSLNPGLASRIPESNFYTFEDYGEEELMEIAHRYFLRNDFVLSDSAEYALGELLAHDLRNAGKNFGNARHVVNLIETRILRDMARRVVSMDAPSAEDLRIICRCDIPKPGIDFAASRERRAVGFRC